MKLGRIAGTVVCSVKDSRLEGMKLLIVQEHDVSLKPTKTFHVAADTVRSGIGDLVLIASGSSARNTEKTNGKAVDCAIIAIVDQVHLEQGIG